MSAIPWRSCLRLFFIFMVCVLFPSSVFATQQILLISLPSAVTVDGTAFSLKDVAEIDGPSDLVKKAGALLLSAEKGMLTRDQVVEVLKVSGLEGIRVKLKMPDAVSVLSSNEGSSNLSTLKGKEEQEQADTFTPQEKEKLGKLLKELALWDGEVLVDFSGTLPNGELVAPSSLVPGTSAASLRFRDSTGREHSLAVRITWLQPTLILARPFRKGEIFKKSDFIIRSIPIIKSGLFASNPSQVLGRGTRRNLKQGEPIPLDSLLDIPIIEKGSKITLVVKSGQVYVKANAEALESGGLGSVIKVRNLSSKVVLTGTVLGKDIVEVNLP